jgi:predicted ATPase
LEITPSVKDSLTARLDQLGAAKQVAQLGSVLGRAFSYELLRALSPDETDLRKVLGELVDREFFFQRGVLPDASFVFKHALLQDAAYSSLLRSKRRELHGRIVEVLEEQFVALTEAQPEYLAHHCGEADMTAKAIAYLQKAGEKSLRGWGLVEATNHYAGALTHLASLPESAERDALELAIRMPLGSALIATKGYAAPEVEETYRRAVELCREGDPPFGVRFGIWAVHLARGDRETVDDMAQWLQAYVTKDQEPQSLLMAHASLATWAFCRGDLELADEEIRETLRRFDPAEHIEVVSRYAGSGGFYGHMFRSWWLWQTGSPESALRHRQEALQIGEGLGDPYALAEAMGFGAALWQFCGVPEECVEAATRLGEIADEQSFHFSRATAACLKGWGWAVPGRSEEGVAMIEQGLTLYRMMSARLFFPYYASLLVEAQLAAGDAAAGLASIDELIQASREGVDSLWWSDLLRLKGALLVLSGEELDAAKCFSQAFEQATAIGAKAYALRAATGWRNLAPAVGQVEESTAALSGILSEFTEGFDLPDLVEARTALDSQS